MAAWLTVYAPIPADFLNVEYLADLVSDPILGDIAESWDFDYEKSLAWFRRAEPRVVDGARDPTLSIDLPDDRRPIEITRLLETSRLAEEVDEARETLEEVAAESRQRVEGLLDGLAEVVTFELGWSALDREEFVLAWYVALELAERCGGLVQDFEQKWWDPGNRSESL